MNDNIPPSADISWLVYLGTVTLSAVLSALAVAIGAAAFRAFNL